MPLLSPDVFPARLTNASQPHVQCVRNASRTPMHIPLRCVTACSKGLWPACSPVVAGTALGVLQEAVAPVAPAAERSHQRRFWKYNVLQTTLPPPPPLTRAVRKSPSPFSIRESGIYSRSLAFGFLIFAPPLTLPNPDLKQLPHLSLRWSHLCPVVLYSSQPLANTDAHSLMVQVNEPTRLWALLYVKCVICVLFALTRHASSGHSPAALKPPEGEVQNTFVLLRVSAHCPDLCTALAPLVLH